MKSFFARLAEINSNEFTKKEQSLIDFIKNNAAKIINSNMRIEHLAQETNTGYSAIYGIIKKLKLNGYKEMITYLQNDLEFMINEQTILKNDGIKNIYVKSIEENFINLTNQKTLDIVNLIENSEKVIVVIWDRELEHLSKQLWRSLWEKNINASLVDRGDCVFKNMINNSNENWTFIFYARETQNSRTIKGVLSDINNKKANIIYFSGSTPSSQISKYITFNHVIILPSGLKLKISDLAFYSFFNDILVSQINKK